MAKGSNPSPNGPFASTGTPGQINVAGQNGPGLNANSPQIVMDQLDPYGLLGDGFNGPEQLAYPQMWANMFGIKVDGSEFADLSTPGGGTAPSAGVSLGNLGLE